MTIGSNRGQKPPAARAAEQEMASRILSRRKLLPFIQRMNPKYLAGWVHEDICRRLERFSDDVAAGLSPRLMLLMPPRAGKSEIASKTFPAWHLGRHPDHEIIACSYNVGLAMDFSKKVKALLEDQPYQTVFEARLDPENKSSESWGLHKQAGGYVAAGVGGGITGKGCHILIIDDPCVAEGQRVRTKRGLVPIENVRVGDQVLTHLNRWRTVLATYDNGVKPVIQLSTNHLKVIVTPEHKVYTSVGWIEAINAKDVYAENMPAVWAGVQREAVEAEVLQHGLFRRITARVTQAMRTLRRGVSTAKRYGAEVLRRGLRGGESARTKTSGMQGVRDDVHDEQGGSEVLLGRMPSHGMGRKDRHNQIGKEHGRCAGTTPREARSAGHANTSLRRMRRFLHAVAYVPAVLLTRLQECCAFGAYEWQRKRELSSRAGRELVHSRVQDSHLTRSEGADRGMCRMWQRSGSGSASFGRSEKQRRTYEPSLPVQLMPHAVAQIYELGMARVYDLTVDEDHSFVAEGIVVHNCKNAEEADSATSREAIWNWYGSTAYTRLAPGGGVLVVQTWWHDDDLAGRLQSEAASADPDDVDVDRFEVVKYPAIAEHNEYLNFDTDLIEYDEVPENGRLLRNKGEALHPARFDLVKLNRIKRTLPTRFWSALYQQNPVPDDGSYFTKDQFRRSPLPTLRHSNVLIAWDFAISEAAHNDYTVGTVGLQDTDDVLHIAEVLRFKSADAFFIVESILNLAKRWYHPSLTIGFEDGQIYRSIAALLKKRMRETKFYPSVEVLRPITDKMARGRALQGRMQQGMVSFNSDGEWYETVRGEMLRFPAGVHDDCVDSAAWMAQMAVGKEPPQLPKEKQPKSWRDKLRFTAGNTTHMAS